MPKKTKKQKLLAELHRKISALSAPSPRLVNTQIKLEEKPNNLPIASGYSFKNQIVTTSKTTNLSLDYSASRRDLMRILIFTIFALISQGVLYFFLRTR